MIRSGNHNAAGSGTRTTVPVRSTATEMPPPQLSGTSAPDAPSILAIDLGKYKRVSGRSTECLRIHEKLRAGIDRRNQGPVGEEKPKNHQAPKEFTMAVRCQTNSRVHKPKSSLAKR